MVSPNGSDVGFSGLSSFKLLRLPAFLWVLKANPKKTLIFGLKGIQKETNHFMGVNSIGTRNGGHPSSVGIHVHPPLWQPARPARTSQTLCPPLVGNSALFCTPSFLPRRFKGLYRRERTLRLKTRSLQSGLSCMGIGGGAGSNANPIHSNR